MPRWLSCCAPTRTLRDDARGELVTGGERTPLVDLDGAYFKLLRDFEARFAAGPPSLVACERLTVEGDVAFGRDVVVRGAVTVRNDGDGQMRVNDGTVFED